MSTNPPPPEQEHETGAAEPWVAPPSPAPPGAGAALETEESAGATAPIASGAGASTPPPQQPGAGGPAGPQGYAPPPPSGYAPPAAQGGYGGHPAASAYGQAPPPDGGRLPPAQSYGPPPQSYGHGAAGQQPGSGGYAAGYPTPGYPGAAYGPPSPTWSPQYPYASWWNRVVATLIDLAFALPFYLLMIVGMILAVANTPTRTRSGAVIVAGNGGLVAFGIILFLIGLLGYAAIMIYNLLVVQGRSGQSWGKRRTGLRVIHEQTGRPLTTGMNLVRQLCHYLDGIAYIGYLWPLWDPKRQTFADKIMTTVVVKER